MTITRPTGAVKSIFGEDLTIVRNEASSFTTAQVWESKAQIEAPQKAGEFTLDFYIEVNVNNIAGAGELRVVDILNGQDELAYLKLNFPADDNFEPFSGSIPVTLDGAAHTYDLQFKRGGDLSTVEVRRARLKLYRIK